MKTTQKCPKCEGREFAVNTERRQPYGSSDNATLPLPEITIGHPAAQRGEKTFKGRVELGCFETWMCLGCGYTEFYACGLTGVREYAARYPDQLRIVNATAKDGPYR